MSELKNFWYKFCAYELDFKDPTSYLMFVPPFLFAVTMVLLVVFRQHIVN